MLNAAHAAEQTGKLFLDFNTDKVSRDKGESKNVMHTAHSRIKATPGTEQVWPSSLRIV